MTTTNPYDRLVELATERHGFVTVKDAEGVGLRPAYLRDLAAAGRLERHAWGLYRLRAVPPGPMDEFQEAILATGGDGVIGGEAALALWDLADTNPREIDVILPTDKRVRRAPVKHVRIRRRRLAAGDVDDVDGVPVLAPHAAIAEAIQDGIEDGLIEQAITAARARKLIGPVAEARLRVQLADRTDRHRA